MELGASNEICGSSGNPEKDIACDIEAKFGKILDPKLVDKHASQVNATINKLYCVLRIQFGAVMAAGSSMLLLIAALLFHSPKVNASIALWGFIIGILLYWFR